jgi:hypothetical protein
MVFFILDGTLMANPTSSHTFFTTLILCLCLSSLAVLPIVDMVNPPALENSGIDADHNTPLDQAESEGDLAAASIQDALAARLPFSKYKTMLLNFRSASLASVFPPPKTYLN